MQGIVTGFGVSIGSCMVAGEITFQQHDSGWISMYAWANVGWGWQGPPGIDRVLVGWDGKQSYRVTGEEAAT